MMTSWQVYTNTRWQHVTACWDLRSIMFRYLTQVEFFKFILCDKFSIFVKNNAILTARCIFTHKLDKVSNRRSDYVPKTWVRFTVVGDGPRVPMRAYLNDVRSEIRSTTAVRSGTNNGHVVLGRRYVSRNGNYATFRIDDLIIWDEALSDELVAMIW